LEAAKNRIENIFAENAFNPVLYSERITNNILGFSPYEVVPNSTIHNVCLYKYPIPKNIEVNGEVIYLSSPMINRCEIFDLSPGKSLVEHLIKEGYQVYLVKYNHPGKEETNLGLEFYGKTIHDTYLEIIKKEQPKKPIHVFGYCMGGTLILPYLARRAEERLAAGKEMDIRNLILMTAPVKFDDSNDAIREIRGFIKENYDTYILNELFSTTKSPP